MLVCLTANAQHNLRTGYFLDGYIYKYKLNPALAADRGYFALPVVGYTSAALETNLNMSNFLYPTEDGLLTTFLSPSISAEQVMKGLQTANPLNLNADISVFSFGFHTKKSFNTIDISVKADARLNIPGQLFSWMKEDASNLDLSNLGLNADARVELAYGYSRKIGNNIRVGARVKLLAGLAKARFQMEKLNLTMTEEEWRVEASGNGYISAPVQFGDSSVESITVMDKEQLTSMKLSDLNLGAAVDLGVSVDVLKYITLSASISDLGFIKWNNVNRLTSPTYQWSYDGFIGIGNEDVDIQDQLGTMGDELLDLTSPTVTAGNDKLTDYLSMMAHVGVELRVPFWQRLSVGALGTARLDGIYSWYEARASVNLALFRWLSFTGNYAYSTYGESYGGAVNFHPAGLNIFIGLDSFKPLMNLSKQYIPVDSFNTTLAVGVNFSIGKYHGRFPKKAKKSKK